MFLIAFQFLRSDVTFFFVAFLDLLSWWLVFFLFIVWALSPWRVYLYPWLSNSIVIPFSLYWVMNFSSAVLFFLTRLRSSIFFSGKFISSPLWAPFLLIRRSLLSRRPWGKSSLPFFCRSSSFSFSPFLVYFCPFSNPKFIRSSSFCLVVFFISPPLCILFSSPRIFFCFFLIAVSF